MAVGIPLRFDPAPPRDAPWILYAPVEKWGAPEPMRVAIAHHADAWAFFDGYSDATVAAKWREHRLVVPGSNGEAGAAGDLPADLIANAFYFLSSWSERRGADRSANRRLFRGSVFDRLDVPQDVVDGYLREVLNALRMRAPRFGEDIGAAHALAREACIRRGTLARCRLPPDGDRGNARAGCQDLASSFGPAPPAGRCRQGFGRL